MQSRNYVTDVKNKNSILLRLNVQKLKSYEFLNCIDDIQNGRSILSAKWNSEHSLHQIGLDLYFK